MQKWSAGSNNLILLTVENEDALMDFVDDVHWARIPYSTFYEPDFGDELTAVAVGPSKESKQLTCHLPLTLSGREEVNVNV